jgi:hypothetical protein
MNIYGSVSHTFCVAKQFSGPKFVAEHYLQWRTQECFLGEGGEGGLHQEFFSGVQQIQLRIEGRENGDLGGGSPLVRGSTQCANE